MLGSGIAAHLDYIRHGQSPVHPGPLHQWGDRNISTWVSGSTSEIAGVCGNEVMLHNIYYCTVQPDRAQSSTSLVSWPLKWILSVRLHGRSSPYPAPRGGNVTNPVTPHTNIQITFARWDTARLDNPINVSCSSNVLAFYERAWEVSRSFSWHFRISLTLIQVFKPNPFLVACQRD